VKRTASILLLAVFLFNVGGYYLVFWGVRQHHNHQFDAQLDANQYSNEETVELKFHIPLPYPSLQYSYERVRGRFEHNGEFYKLIKKQLQNDTLYVVCIRDVQEQQIVETMKTVENLATDTPASEKELSVFSKLLKDFESHEDPAITGIPGWVQSFLYSIEKFPINSVDPEQLSPPPKV
jgi:hypothetical protein